MKFIRIPAFIASALVAIPLLFLITSFSSPVKIIFLGDSITQGGVVGQGYINQIAAKLGNEGGERYQLVGKGMGGNMVRHLLARVEHDVIAEKPDKVVILVGINDVGFFTWHPQEGGTPINEYELGLLYLVNRLKSRGIKPILCTPTIIGEKPFGQNPLDATLDLYADVVRKVSRQTGVPVCDLRKTFLRHLDIHNAANRDKLLTTDSVHLNDEGNKLLAETLFPFLVE